MKRRGSFFPLWRRKQSVGPEDFQRSQTHPDDSRKEQETHAENGALRSRNVKEQETELQAVLINFNIKENNEAHRAEECETKTLMLRRGQVFDVTVQFNRDYNPDTDVIALQFNTDRNAMEGKAGVVRVEVRDALLLSKWGMQVKETNGKRVRLSIMSSAQAAIGCYDVMVETKFKNSSQEVSLYRCKNGERICFIEDN